MALQPVFLNRGAASASGMGEATASPACWLLSGPPVGHWGCPVIAPAPATLPWWPVAAQPTSCRGACQCRGPCVFCLLPCQGARVLLPVAKLTSLLAISCFCCWSDSVCAWVVCCSQGLLSCHQRSPLVLPHDLFRHDFEQRHVQYVPSHPNMLPVLEKKASCLGTRPKQNG
jgi:hypothetical protein